MCKACSLHILNGRMEDTIGNVTRVGTNGNSVMDHWLVDDAAANIVSKFFCVLHSILESDHIPLAIKLSSLKADTRRYECDEDYFK